MSSKVSIRNCALFIISLAEFFLLGRGDIVEVTMGHPLSTPNKCHYTVDDLGPFGSMIASAGGGMWIGGQACGNVYTLSCTAASGGHCIDGATVDVIIVNQASNDGTIFELTKQALEVIATTGTTSINADIKLKYRGNKRKKRLF